MSEIETDPDFKKGWHSHIVCDNVMKKVFGEVLPDIVGGSRELWLKRSAVKVLHDVYLAQDFDTISYWDALDYIESPNGENIDQMERGNQDMKNVHKEKSKFSIDDILVGCRIFVDDETAEDVKSEVLKIQNDEKVVQTIESIYPKMLKYANDYFPVKF